MHLPALFSYLQGLRENNNKGWFVMNKPAYDILRPEFMALVGEVIGGLAKHDRTIVGVDPKKALFRIHRDIRFSNDKTPYKTRFSASIAAPAAKHSGPMYYLSIDADGRLHLGAGCWLPAPDVLVRLRRHVVAEPERLRRVLANRKLRATFGGLSDEDKLARLPKGYDPKAPGIERWGDYVRYKSFVVGADRDLTAPAEAATARDLAPAIVATLAAATPLNDWIRAGLAAPFAAPEDPPTG